MTHQLQIQIQKPAQASSKAMFQSQKTEAGITRTEYRKARLAECADIVAYCKREGIECNPRQTA